LNISKGYEYFPVRETLYAIINSNDYIFSVEEENPYIKYLVITSNNCSEFYSLLYSKKYMHIIDVFKSPEEQLYIPYYLDENIYLSKIDYYGEIYWNKTLSEYAPSYMKTMNFIINDENNIMYSINRSIYILDYDGAVIKKIDLSNILNYDVSIKDFIVLSDKNILIYYTEIKDYWSESSSNLLKISADGSIIFDVNYNDEKYRIWNYANEDLFETVEGGYVLVLSPGLMADDIFSIKIESNGIIEWDINERFYYQTKNGYYYSIGSNYVTIYGPDYPLLSLSTPYGDSYGEGRYLVGSEITFGVEPEKIENTETKNTFIEWQTTDPNGYNGSNNPASVIITNNLEETAIWNTQHYIEFHSKKGQINESSGWYNEGASLNLEAVPLGDYEFIGWDIRPMGAYSVVNNILEIEVTEPLVISAIFKEKVRRLTIESEIGTTSGAGIYPMSEVVHFSVSPSIIEGDVRYTFQNWFSIDEGGYSGSDNPALVILNNNVTQVALWKTEYYIDIDANQGGSLSFTKGWYEDGSKIKIQATPDQGYVFTGWLDENSEALLTENTLDIVVEKPYRLTAQFERENTGIPSYPIISLIIGTFVFISLKLRAHEKGRAEGPRAYKPSHIFLRF
jgi:general stress protein 26